MPGKRRPSNELLNSRTCSLVEVSPALRDSATEEGIVVNTWDREVRLVQHTVNAQHHNTFEGWSSHQDFFIKNYSEYWQRTATSNLFDLPIVLGQPEPQYAEQLFCLCCSCTPCTVAMAMAFQSVWENPLCCTLS